METTAFINPIPVILHRPTSSSLISSTSPLRPRRMRHAQSTRLVATISQPASSDAPDDKPTDESESTEETTTDTSEETEEQQTSTTTTDPFENAQQQLQTTINSVFNAFYTPIRSACPILSSSWQPKYGNYILYPTTKPKSVIHFLGGAFFGAVPHHLYHSLLSRLAEKGHVIVATPYNLSFDYLPVANSIASAWESVESDLAFEFGPLPVIGLGHSGGTVFHSLINTLFNDAAPKAANIFISFNNREAKDAIPNYKDIIKPLANQSVYIRDEVLPKNIQDNIDSLPGQVDDFISNNLFVPTALRDELLPLSKQNRQFLGQVPPLFDEIAEGGKSEDVKEFYPPPQDIQKSIQRLYDVGHNLLIRFNNDNLDDTLLLQEVLSKNVNQVNSSVVELTGTHLTPLVQDSPDLNGFVSNLPFVAPGTETLASGLSGILGELVGSLGARDLSKLEVVIDEWIDAGISSGKF